MRLTLEWKKERKCEKLRGILERGNFEVIVVDSTWRKRRGRWHGKKERSLSGEGELSVGSLIGAKGGVEFGENVLDLEESVVFVSGLWSEESKGGYDFAFCWGHAEENNSKMCVCCVCWWRGFFLLSTGIGWVHWHVILTLRSALHAAYLDDVSFENCYILQAELLPSELLRIQTLVCYSCYL